MPLTIAPNLSTLCPYNNGSSLISCLWRPQKKTPHFSASHHPGAIFATTSNTWSWTASNPTDIARGLGDALSHSTTQHSTRSASLEQREGSGRPPQGGYNTLFQSTMC